MSKQTKKAMKANNIKRITSMEDLRETFADVIYEIRTKAIKHEDANALARQGNGIIAAIKVQLAYCAQAGEKPFIPWLGSPKRPALPPSPSDRETASLGK